MRIRLCHFRDQPPGGLWMAKGESPAAHCPTVPFSATRNRTAKADCRPPAAGLRCDFSCNSPPTIEHRSFGHRAPFPSSSKANLKCSPSGGSPGIPLCCCATPRGGIGCTRGTLLPPLFGRLTWAGVLGSVSGSVRASSRGVLVSLLIPLGELEKTVGDSRW